MQSKLSRVQLTVLPEIGANSLAPSVGNYTFVFPEFPFLHIEDLTLQVEPEETKELEDKTMTRKGQKPTEEQVQMQDPEAVSTDMMME